MQLNSVVLPAPFGPISAVISPARAVKLKSLTATRPPKRIVRCSTDEQRRGAHAGLSVRASATISGGMSLRPRRKIDGVRADTSPRGR